MIYINTPRNYTFRKKPIRSAHLISDIPGKEGTRELTRFAVKIGLKRRWMSKYGKSDEHFDVMNTFIDKALKTGARQIDKYKFANIIKKKRGE